MSAVLSDKNWPFLSFSKPMLDDRIKELEKVSCIWRDQLEIDPTDHDLLQKLIWADLTRRMAVRARWIRFG